MISTFNLQLLGFTPTQARVINGLASGMSNKEIAEAIFIHEKSVKGHLTEIYRKAGVKSRLQMVVWLGEKEKAGIIKEITSEVAI